MGLTQPPQVCVVIDRAQIFGQAKSLDPPFQSVLVSQIEDSYGDPVGFHSSKRHHSGG